MYIEAYISQDNEKLMFLTQPAAWHHAMNELYDLPYNISKAWSLTAERA